MIPLMNTGERGYFDALTERVLGAVFEVSNTLGGRTLCLLVNFQKPKVEWKRVVYAYQIPTRLRRRVWPGRLFPRRHTRLSTRRRSGECPAGRRLLEGG